MEPRPFDRGNFINGVKKHPESLASMEPRPFDRGNLTWGSSPVANCLSFNGAAAFRPWKHCVAWWRNPTMTCFNGATAFRPWKPPTARYPTPRQSCFNGATAFRPWKPSGWWPPGRWQGCFNGATAFRPWKLGITPEAYERVVLLQWSHGLSTVETLPTQRFSCLSEGRASMEPRPFDRGNSQIHCADVPICLASMEPRPFDRGNSLWCLFSY